MSGGYTRYLAPTVADLTVMDRETLQPALKAAERLDSTDRVRAYRTSCPTGAAVTTSVADVTGCVQTITIRGAAAFVWVAGTFDVIGSPAAAFWLIRGQLWLNGVQRTGEASKYISKNDRVTVTKMWPFALAAGQHELKLRILKDAGAGTASYNAIHTAITSMIVDIP